MKKTLSIFIVTVFLFVASVASVSAATYYVSPSGNDTGAGSDTSPFRTFARATKSLLPGDTLIAKDGTYTEALDTSNADVAKRVYFPSGTAGSPITIKSQNRLGAIIKPPSGYAILSVGNISRAVRYLNIDGLVFDGANLGDSTIVGNAIVIAGKEADTTWVSNINFTNNEIRNVGAKIDATKLDFNAVGTRNHPAYKNNYEYWSSAMMVKDCTNIYIAGNYIHHNGVTDFDHGIYQYSQNTIIENNIIYNNRGTGVKGGWQSGVGSKSIVRNNLFYNNGMAQFVRGLNGSVAGRKPRGLSSHFSQDYEYYNNIVFGKYSAGGIDIIYGPQRTRVYNNFVYNTGGPGIIIGGGAQITPQVWDVAGSLVKNNIVYTTDPLYPAINIASRARDAVVENNITFGANAQVAINSAALNITARNNLSTDPRFVSWPAAYADSQRQLGSTTEANTLKSTLISGLKLQSSSPAINKGMTLAEVKSDFINVVRPQGGSYEIGPFEFGGIPTATVPPATTTPTLPPPPVGITPMPTAAATSTSGVKLGDANRDNRVDNADYTIWLNEFKTKSGTTSDFNKDGRVDGVDLTIWLLNYGK